MKSLLAISLLFSFIPHSFAANCEIQTTQLPHCPSSRTRIAPKHFPAQIFYVPDNSEDDVLSFLNALETGQKIALEGDFSRNQRLANDPKYRDKIILTSQKAKQYRAEGDIPGISRYTGYQRDTTVFGFDPVTRRVLQFSGADETETDYNICGLEVAIQDTGDKLNTANANLGGNIMGHPNGGCLVGENMDSSLAVELCGEGNPIIRLNTTGTTVGHIDELYNVIPSSRHSKPCDFKFVVTNPNKFTEILKSNPNENFFNSEMVQSKFYQSGEPKLFNENKAGNVGRNPHANICKLVEKFNFFQTVKEHQSRLQPRQNPPGGGSDSNDSLDTTWSPLHFLIPNSHAAGAALGRKGQGRNCNDEPFTRSALPPVVGRNPETYREKCLVEDTIKDYGYDKLKSKKVNCQKVKNKDIIDLLALDSNEIDNVLNRIPETIEGVVLPEHIKLKSELLSLKRLSEGNSEISKAIAENKERLMDSLPSECRDKDMLVEVPALFNGSRSLTPNPANLLVIGKTAFIPGQFNDAITREIEKEISSTGLSTSSVDTFSAHVGGGNLHCKTNEIRICNP